MFFSRPFLSESYFVLVANPLVLDILVSMALSLITSWEDTSFLITPLSNILFNLLKSGGIILSLFVPKLPNLVFKPAKSVLDLSFDVSISAPSIGLPYIVRQIYLYFDITSKTWIGLRRILTYSDIIFFLIIQLLHKLWKLFIWYTFHHFFIWLQPLNFIWLVAFKVYRWYRIFHFLYTKALWNLWKFAKTFSYFQNAWKVSLHTGDFFPVFGLSAETCKSPYSVRLQENTDQKKLCIWTLFTQCNILIRSTILNLGS